MGPNIWKTLTDSSGKKSKETNPHKDSLDTNGLEDVYVSTETLLKGKCLIDIMHI
jgi:hypothetical protein